MLELPKDPLEISISEKYADIAEEYAIRLGESESFTFRIKQKDGTYREYAEEGSMGFRHKCQFQLLLKAFALMRGDKEVNDEDSDKLKSISKWLNYEFNPS
ncbi:MAG: hypothetical protein QG670_1916 [Thermoproteota archaeon]|nr:hypothetical protein [Thermoproteota archaeon]